MPDLLLCASAHWLDFGRANSATDADLRNGPLIHLATLTAASNTPEPLIGRSLRVSDAITNVAAVRKTCPRECNAFMGMRSPHNPTQ
jgi:hypothetical protein